MHPQGATRLHPPEVGDRAGPVGGHDWLAVEAVRVVGVASHRVLLGGLPSLRLLAGGLHAQLPEGVSEGSGQGVSDLKEAKPHCQTPLESLEFTAWLAGRPTSGGHRSPLQSAC